MSRSRWIARVMVALLVLASCSTHHERELTGWLKVDVVRPPGGSSGVVVAGVNEEVFYGRVGGEWQRLGSGHPTRYMVLMDGARESYQPGAQPLALLDLNDRRGLQVAREGEATLRPLAQFFGRSGRISVPADRSVVDFLECRPSEERCRELRVHRHEVGGRLVKTFTLTLSQDQTACGMNGIRWYDGALNPVVDAACDTSLPEGPQCIWLTPQKEGLVARAVARDRPPLECAEPSGLGLSLGRPATMEVLY